MKHPCYDLVPLNVTVTQQKKNGDLTLNCNTETQSSSKDDSDKIIELSFDEFSTTSRSDVTVALNDKIQDLKKRIEDNRKAGYKITDEFLYNNFDYGLIDRLKRSGQLIKQGNGENVFGG